MIAFDWAEADVYDDARSIALNDAQLRLYGRSKGILHDQASTELFDASRAFLFEKSTASVFIEPLMKINVAAFNDSVVHVRGCRGLDNFYTKGQRQSSLSSSLSSHQFSHGLLSKRKLSHYPVNVYLYDRATLKLPVRCQQYVSVVRRGLDSFINMDSSVDSVSDDQIAPKNLHITEDRSIFSENFGKADGANIDNISPESQDAFIQNTINDGNNPIDETSNHNASSPIFPKGVVSSEYNGKYSWIGFAILHSMFIIGAAVII